MDDKEFNKVGWINNALKYFFGYFNSNVNNNVFSKLDWINIFLLKIFQDYFNLKELQELSKLSKLTRSTLNSVLFKSIRLLRRMKRVGCSRSECFNVKSLENLSQITVESEDEVEKNLNVKESLRKISYELTHVNRFINSIFIYNMKLSGLYLYPLLNIFVSLSEIKIHCSTIQYSIFQKLGEYFPMLTTFELYMVALSKESTTSVNSNEIIFPVNLSCLSICCVEVTDISILSDPYKIVFTVYDRNYRSKFALPNIRLPSLKKLQFLRCSFKNNGLKEFLQTNPNLKQLNIDNFSPGMSKYFSSLKSLHVEQLYNIINLNYLRTHQNIKTLKINVRYNRFYDKFEKICLMCPSVEFLHLDIGCANTCQDAINNYLAPILKKLPNLKTIELPIYVKGRMFINCRDLPQIEKIILEVHTSDLDVNFENHNNLREIEFRNNYRDINKEEFLEKYKNYKEWKFKFFERNVKGYKINSKD